MARDICTLTGEHGAYVDCHLIPKALTRPEEKGKPFLQAGGTSRPTRRWSSWYDPALVTAAGERILARYDGWAIRELRRHNLVWSGWGSDKKLVVNDHFPITESGHGLRRVRSLDGRRLRLFILSLLWRAAATRLPEFREVTLESVELEKMRVMVRDGRVEPIDFYPAQLIQLSTLGLVHNHTPLADKKLVPSLYGTPAYTTSMFRFYFDGLIIHVLRPPTAAGEDWPNLGSLFAGCTDELLVTTVPYEMSFQRDNLRATMREAYGELPDHESTAYPPR
jgi:hypothetical protein